MRAVVVFAALALMAAAPLAPARDGDIAIAQELVEARTLATVAAYDLFIARHPGHRLVKTAKSERAQVAAKAR